MTRQGAATGTAARTLDEGERGADQHIPLRTVAEDVGTVGAELEVTGHQSPLTLAELANVESGVMAGRVVHVDLEVPAIAGERNGDRCRRAAERRQRLWCDAVVAEATVPSRPAGDVGPQR